ncbi:MAG: outer membrane protein assembly factor BamD [Cryomorphaceae bacterium]|nr:outer membrane protein assembly factor BamD [Cryomorphaceae bacterium]
MIKSRRLFPLLSRLMMILIIVGMTGCSEYQKVLKSTDTEYKFKMAKKYFEQEKYVKAYPLIDELVTLYRGTDRFEETYFLLAMTHYHLGEYILSGYHFKNFHKTYPKSRFAEEALFMSGFSYYKESPDFSLEQSYTYKAINQIQLFVNTYRNSQRLEECNELIRELRHKLERKAYKNAKQYFNTKHYQSAAIALTNVLQDFPETRYREEVMYLIVMSKYELARFSIPSKQLLRYIETRTSAEQFEDLFPTSKKVTETREILQIVNEQINLMQSEPESL